MISLSLEEKTFHLKISNEIIRVFVEIYHAFNFQTSLDLVKVKKQVQSPHKTTQNLP